MREDYLTEATITRFTGVALGPEHPYAYGEPKRVLKLTLAELRKDPRLKKLGMEPNGKGRSAITAKDGTSVWDFVSLRHARRGVNFTSCPHLTLSIQSQRIVVIVTLPSAVPAAMRRNLTSL